MLPNGEVITGEIDMKYAHNAMTTAKRDLLVTNNKP